MNQYDERKELLKKYYLNIRTSFNFYVIDDIPMKKIENASKTFAFGVDKSRIIGFYDTTIMENGKAGYLFTDTKVYYLESLGKPGKLWYDEIQSVELTNINKKDCDRGIQFYNKDGSVILWTSSFLNKTPLLNFFKELLKVNNVKNEMFHISRYSPLNSGSMSSGIMLGNYRTISKLYSEEKFHARQGHGFAAERANNLFENLTGHNSYIVGDSNVKNGADRIVDGQYIQSKYCTTGSKCINECFENKGKGEFRYLKNGKPMQIEVPSDKYASAVQAMEEKIRRGQVKGVTDITEAKQIVRKGHFTYEQAKNIAKAGTIESLTYDAINGVVGASSAFGVTGLLAFAFSLWNGEDYENALKKAIYSGLKMSGTAFATGIIASQLSRAGLNSVLVGSSEAIVSFMGPKASSVLVNAFRNGGNIYGAAAMKSAAKLLRGNTITAGISVIVLSSVDIADIFRGKISGKQLFKNMTNTTFTVAGGVSGWLIGTAIATVLFPGAGTLAGGLLGSFSGGATAGKVSDKLLSNFLENDADEMVQIIEKVFGKIANDYLLNQIEAEKSVDKLSKKLDGKILKIMFANDDRETFARALLIPIVEEVISQREKIIIPSNREIILELRKVLECLSDTI